MAWKALLVHLKPYNENAPALAAALSIARRFDASLTGLHPMRELAMLKLLVGPDSPSAREAEARDAPLARKAKDDFLAACREAGVAGQFEIAEGNANEVLCLAGRVHDVLIVEAGGSLDGRGGDLVEECAVTAGTATIIVPSSGAEQFGQTIAVAWNHSRQSAAAVHAALPLIERAQNVVVLLGEDRDAMPSVTRRPAADIGSYLRLHNPNVRVVALSATDGADLQSAALAAGADLLVMGAYGRSAWREFLFGGATRAVVENLRLPVLMAH
ncbi:MAG: universal stress protein [Hyphomicrobium sp.]|nr:universal stress protein [Hyphomicrobium sp.]